MHWMARVVMWKSMGITPGTPMEMIHALGVWAKETTFGGASWHQLHHMILMYTQAEPRTIPYEAREKELLTWR
jgi:hypothetical protein